MENDKTIEIIERLSRMETKLDDFTSLREKAEEAYNTSKQNAKDIEEIKIDNKHMWYTVGAIAVTIIGYLLKITVFK